MKRNCIRIFILSAFLTTIFFCYKTQKKIDVISPANQPEMLMYLPSGKYLKPLMLGFDQIAADILWIKAIGYFGGHYMTDRNYQWLYHILDLTTTLDPYFRYPYEFGGVVLAVEKEDFEHSNKLLKKGMQYHSDYWRFPFYLGFNSFFRLKDPETAARYISTAAALPDCPSYLPKLAASLYAHSGQKETALNFLNRMYQDMEVPWLKKSMAKKIENLQKGVLPKSLGKILASGESSDT
jgi:hypothetical protein